MKMGQNLTNIQYIYIPTLDDPLLQTQQPGLQAPLCFVVLYTRVADPVFVMRSNKSGFQNLVGSRSGS